MEDKINIAGLLKDCPKGMALDCLLCNNPIELEGVVGDEATYPIRAVGKDGFHHVFTAYGASYNHDDAKCVIFPKDKTTWEGFHRPFKDGDIVTSVYQGVVQAIGIFDYEEQSEAWIHVCIDLHNEFFTAGYLGYVYDLRLATEEEKQKLFQVIKDNGYKWNCGTKTLEKLEDMDDKGNISDGYHTFNELYEYRLLYNASMFNELAKQGLYDVHKSKRHSDGTIPFGDENWFIVQAELPTGQISNHYEMKDWDLFNIPEKERANPYDGHTPQDVAKRLRDFLSLENGPKFKVGDIVLYEGPLTKGIMIIESFDYGGENQYKAARAKIGESISIKTGSSTIYSDFAPGINNIRHATDDEVIDFVNKEGCQEYLNFYKDWLLKHCSRLVNLGLLNK